MLRTRDVILIVTLYFTMGAGILVPRVGSVLEESLTAFIMVLLFLSFLPIRLHSVWKTMHRSGLFLVSASLLKLGALPLSTYALCRWLAPEYALSVLLLSGVSTGVVAPFISNVVEGNTPLVVVLVVITSMLAPFTLPVLVKVLAGRHVDISWMNMVRMLATVMLVPMLLGEFLHRTLPSLAAGIVQRQFPFALALLAGVNMAVFSRYSAYLHESPRLLLEAAVLAFALAFLHLLAGLAVFCRASIEDRLAGIVSMTNVNNVLIIVFASQFFGAMESTVAGMYLLPFYAVVVPLRLAGRFRFRMRGEG